MEDSVGLVKSSVAVSVAIYVVYRFLAAVANFRRYAKIFNDCPGNDDFHPVYGNLHTFPGPNEAGLQYDIEVMEKRPRFTRVWAGPVVPVLLLYHPDLVRIILKSSAPKPCGGIFASVYEMGLGWLGEGLLISNSTKWSRNRRLLTPAFHFDILKPYVHVKNRAADVLLDKIQHSSEENKSFEVFDYVSLCLFDILLQCAFNEESNCQTSSGEGVQYLKSVNQLVTKWSERSLRPWLHVDCLYPYTSHGKQWYKLCDFVHSVSERLIRKRQKHLEKSTARSASSISAEASQDGDTPAKKQMLSFVDILLSAKDEEGKGMTFTEIRNEADTFLFEGYDTTTSALSWTLYSLARWPEHQTKVQEEIDALLKGRSSIDILCKDLNQLPYTTACIKEAIRNYSTVPFIERETVEEMDIDGHKIPAGTFIAVQIWMLHHNPQVWEDPHDYRPDRFLGDNLVKMDPFQFVPFSAGPRNCIGQNFAMHELKVLVARIFSRFTLTLDPDHEILRQPLATFKAEKGIKLFASPRK